MGRNVSAKKFGCSFTSVESCPILPYPQQVRWIRSVASQLWIRSIVLGRHSIFWFALRRNWAHLCFVDHTLDFKQRPAMEVSLTVRCKHYGWCWVKQSVDGHYREKPVNIQSEWWVYTLQWSLLTKRNFVSLYLVLFAAHRSLVTPLRQKFTVLELCVH